MSRRLQVVGVRAEFWARDTGHDRETVLFGPDYFTLASLTPATMARMMSTSGADDGAVDYWPEVGGQTEVRDADTGETLWVYRGGRRFSPAALAEAEARLAAPAPAAPPAAVCGCCQCVCPRTVADPPAICGPCRDGEHARHPGRLAPPVPLIEQAARAVADATGLGQIAEMGKVLAGFVLVERARGVVVSVAAYREHALRLGTEAAADSAIEYAAVWLGMHDDRRDGGGPCGCYPECKIPAARP